MTHFAKWAPVKQRGRETLTHFAKAGLGGAAGAGILDTLYTSGPRRGRRGGNPSNIVQHRASAERLTLPLAFAEASRKLRGSSAEARCPRTARRATRRFFKHGWAMDKMHRLTACGNGRSQKMALRCLGCLLS